jgi:hypothetical protein
MADYYKSAAALLDIRRSPEENTKWTVGVSCNTPRVSVELQLTANSHSLKIMPYNGAVTLLPRSRRISAGGTDLKT